MVKTCWAVVAFFALGAVGEAVAESKPDSVIYTAPEGWRFVMLGPASEDAMRKIMEALHVLQRGGDWEGVGKLYELMLEEEGFWLTCELELNGCKVEIWRDSQAVVALRCGGEIRSVAVVASLDGYQTVVHDNRRRPFVVSERSVYAYQSREPRVYLKFPKSFHSWEVASFGFAGVKTRDCSGQN